MRNSVEYDVPVTMRDGIILYADVYRPDGVGPWPVVVVRGPYGKQNPLVRSLTEPFLATKRGIMVVVQDTRSRFGSGGGE